MKEYINDKQYPAKVNIIVPSKENYQPPPTIKEILLDLVGSIIELAPYQNIMIISFTSYGLQIYVLSIITLVMMD